MPKVTAPDPETLYQPPRRQAAVDGTLREVLDSVRLSRARSRLDVVRRTGLSRAVVAQRVQDLVTLGLLEEGATIESTGGRPARQLRFAAGTGTLLVADLGARGTQVAVTDLAGRILDRRSEASHIAAGPEAILGRIEALMDELHPGASPPLRGIGIGVPGPVEFATALPIAPPIMPGWDRYPIRERLEARYGAPVWVDNDVNLMAFGELRFGVARGHRDVVFIKIGTGIGAGVISGGSLHRGAQGSAGDVGHIAVVDDTSVICRCGKVGCLEAVAGGAAIARDAEAAARDGRSPWLAAAMERAGEMSAALVLEAAARGEPVSVELLQRSGRHVGMMLAGVVNFFNPSLVVIGGGVADAGDLLLSAVRQVVYGRSLPLATRELQIRSSSLPGDCGILGAASVVADELFAAHRLAALEARPDDVLADVSRVAASA